MREALRELLEVEEAARVVVEDAGKEAEKIRRDARVKSDALVEEARRDALDEAQGRRRKAIADARAQRDRLIDQAREKIELTTAVSEDGHRGSVEMVVRVLLGADES